MVCSSAFVLCVGKDEAEIARRAAAIGREVAEPREHGVAGTPAEAVDILGRYAEASASGCTCRFSTSPISTTWSWSPPRWPRSWADSEPPVTVPTGAMLPWAAASPYGPASLWTVVSTFGSGDRDGRDGRPAADGGGRR